MPGFAASISDQVKKDTGFNLVYPPGTPLRLGDVMERSSGIWIPVGNLGDDLGFATESVGDTTPGDFQPSSARGYSVDVKLSGQPSAVFKYLTDAEAGVKVTLSGENAFLLSLEGATVERIASIDKFWREVKERRGLWTWRLSRRVVTSLVRCKSTTFLASGSESASFEMSAEVDLKTGPINIAQLAAGFELRSTMSARDSFVSKGDSTPLFGAYKVGLLNVGPASLDSAKINDTTLQPADE